MRVYSICRKCAEVHPAELECPACAIGTFPIGVVHAPVVRARRPVADPIGPSAFPSDGSPARRVARASALVVSAYVFAVVVLLLAVFAQA